MTQTFTEVLVIEHCCNCGIAFGMERSFRDKMLELGPAGKFQCLRCMREFAAQEVEEYKAKLKNEIAGLIIGLAPSEEDWNKGWSKGLYDVVKLIDTVK